MSYAAFKRDVNDPKTIDDFTNVVQSPERLRLLLVLTVADIRAVGPNVWNGWKAALLRDLYWRAEEVLSGQSIEVGQANRASAVWTELRAALSDWDAESFEAHAARGYPSYWLSYDVETLTHHARLVRQAEASQRLLTVDIRVDSYREVTEITVYTADHPGLFSRIAGAMASVGANIVDARITTMRNGMALDSLWVQDANRETFDGPDTQARLTTAIEQALSGCLELTQAIEKRPSLLPKRARGMTIAPRVLIDNKASKTHTVVEVNGTDRPGLLHRLTVRLAHQNLQISAAKISTYGASIVDVFYVKDLFGLKVNSDRKLDGLKNAMLAELEPQVKTAKKAVARAAE
jgi:[protein-PII] uridylyltransferase